MKSFSFVLLFLYFFCYSVDAQKAFRVMFYNVENLFDTEDDPKKDDADFLPDGAKHWTYGRYKNKLTNLSKVITTVGEWGSPAIVGMCEVENDKVMKDLTQYSTLKSQNYKYVVTECKDNRGIDVALMYQRDQFRYINHRAYKVSFPYNKAKRTRDILHVYGQVLSGDTLDVFVCHFPSRRGGETESEPDRVQAASVLRSKVDSLMKIRLNSNIVIIGDFNDEPSNKSISKTLQAEFFKNNPNRNKLYNLFSLFEKQESKGSFKYRNQWNVLDQVIVSGNLMNRNHKFHVLPETATIFDQSFLLVDDKTNGGKRLKKTYNGMKHEGGYSDHLPVFVDFSVSSQK